MTSVAAAIRAALLTAQPVDKAFAARTVARDWAAGRLGFAFDCTMPDRPARPAQPELLPPSQMPKRNKAGSERGRIALWHSLAHIEFVAIDLALDMAGRFGGKMGREFVADFLAVAADEAMHFALIERMALKGMVRELARNCVLASNADGVFKLTLPPSHSALLTDNALLKRIEALHADLVGEQAPADRPAGRANVSRPNTDADIQSDSAPKPRLPDQGTGVWRG